MIFDFTLIVAFGFIGGFIARRLKQPAVVGYLLAGVTASFIFSGFIENREAINAIAQIGVALLLFTVGIEMNFSKIKRVFNVAVVGALLQIPITLVIFRLILPYFNLDPFEALIVAAAFSLSSTAVVVKILGEKGMLESFPGEVMTGWLLTQDMAVVPLVMLIPFFQGNADTGSLTDFLFSITKALLFISVLFLVGKPLISRLLTRVARFNASELLLLATVTVCLVIAYLTELMGLSFVLGAFFAGVLISDTTENHAVFNEIRPLRDFFAVIFFVSISLLVPIETTLSHLPTALLISAIVIFVKFLVVFILSLLLKLHSRVSFMVAMGLVQVGEFSFLIAWEALQNNFISQDAYALVLNVSIITIIATPFLINSAPYVYHAVHDRVKRRSPQFIKALFHHAERYPERDELPLKNHVVLCGFGRMGRYIGRALESANIPYIVIEYNRYLVTNLRSMGIPVVYGDPSDREILDYAQVDLAKLLVVAIPDMHTQKMVITNARNINGDITIISRTHYESDQQMLKAIGADYIVQPEFSAAISVVERVLKLFHIEHENVTGTIARLKIEHGIST